MPEPPLVLVADADPGVNALAARVLVRAGFRVRTLSGPAAVAGARATDVRLVVVGGATACVAAVELRATGDRTPVLILAGYPSPEATRLAGADATVRIVRKPFTPADLAAAARAVTGPYGPAAPGSVDVPAHATGETLEE